MLRSIPPITSTGPNRSHRMRRPDPNIRVGTPTKEDGWQATPVVQRNPPRSPNPLSLFPERNGPEVTEESNGVWVIVEFPQHTDLSQIKWHEEDNLLIVGSTLLGCPYQNRIALPENRGKRVEVKLHNGLFIVKFEK